MPAAFLSAVLVAPVLGLLARLLAPGLPRPSAARLRPLEVVAVLVGLLGLVFHCGAMFYRSLVETVPGTAWWVHTVNAMGTGSVVAYVVPALLLLVGLRRLPVPVVLLCGAALLAVGITMYAGVPLRTHLGAIVLAAWAVSLAVAAFAVLRLAPRTA